MDELQKSLTCTIGQLRMLEESALEWIKDAPDGSLRISHANKKAQYYWHLPETGPQGRYMRKSETDNIRSLAQKDYAKRLLPVIRSEIARMERMLDGYEPSSVRAVYDNLVPDRKLIVDPGIMTDEEYASQWLEDKNRFKSDHQKYVDYSSVESDIVTELGEHVRSKSEKIIADKLYLMNIPYIYECPLLLKGIGYILPDFIILNVRTRKEYIHEHMGMMDNCDYADSAVRKIESYEKNDIYQGRNLIITYETSAHPLNTKLLDGMFRTFFL